MSPAPQNEIISSLSRCIELSQNGTESTVRLPAIPPPLFACRLLCAIPDQSIAPAAHKSVHVTADVHLNHPYRNQTPKTHDIVDFIPQDAFEKILFDIQHQQNDYDRKE